MEQQDLIPGLPDDVASECLLRVSCDYVFLLKDVCRRWKQELYSPDFAHRRRLAGLSQPLFFFSFCSWLRVGKRKRWIQFIALFNPTSGHWRRLPPIPIQKKEFFFKLVGAGHRIVALNFLGLHGSDRNVYIYDLITNTWTCGTPCPVASHGLSMALASDGVQRVFVAGGYGPYGPVRSAMLYDVDNDNWEWLPDMNITRSGSKGFFNAGVFHVIGGSHHVVPMGLLNMPVYPPLVCAERFNVSTRDWSLELNFAPKLIHNFVVAPDGRIYNFLLKEMRLMIKEGKSWRLVSELPSAFKDRVTQISAWKEGFLLVRRRKMKLDQFYLVALRTDSQSLVWKEVKQPDKYEMEPMVNAACYLEV